MCPPRCSVAYHLKSCFFISPLAISKGFPWALSVSWVLVLVRFGDKICIEGDGGSGLPSGRRSQPTPLPHSRRWATSGRWWFYFAPSAIGKFGMVLSHAERQRQRHTIFSGDVPSCNNLFAEPEEVSAIFVGSSRRGGRLFTSSHRCQRLNDFPHL